MNLPSSSDTRRILLKVNFKWSTVGLNLVFSFSSISRINKAKEPITTYP